MKFQKEAEEGEILKFGDGLEDLPLKHVVDISVSPIPTGLDLCPGQFNLACPELLRESKDVGVVYLSQAFDDYTGILILDQGVDQPLHLSLIIENTKPLEWVTVWHGSQAFLNS
jgi:hypothetical protein